MKICKTLTAYKQKTKTLVYSGNEENKIKIKFGMMYYKKEKKGDTK